MTDKIPARLNDSADGLGDFQTGDTVGLTHGGTGATSAAQARSNLDAVSSVELATHVNDGNNPHSVSAAQVGAPTDAEFTALENTLVNHLGDFTNPHNTTPALIGAIPDSEKGAANGVATLDVGGKIPSSQIPAIAIPSVHVVQDATARLALTVQEGDEAIQLDDGSQWIVDENTAWQPRPLPGKTPVYLQAGTAPTGFINVNVTTAFAIDFDAPSPITPDMTALTASRMQTLVAGDFRVSYSLTADNFTNNRKNIRCALRVNGTEVAFSESASYSRNGTDSFMSCNNDMIVPLAAGDYVELFVQRTGTSGFAQLTSAQINLEKVSYG